MMNLKQLFDTQRILDERIAKEHPVQEGEDRFAKKILALLSELGECANEQRSWKFWSKDQKPRTIKYVPFEETQCENYDLLYCEICGDYYDIDHGLAHEHREDDLVPYVITNPLLTEYVDNLHFILSLGRDKGINIPSEYKREWMIKEKDIVKQFLAVFSLASRFGITKSETDFNLTLDTFMGLGEMLGFTWEEIEASYYEKNEINHGRQDNSY